ncbi:hypothetical protein AVEN_73733-1 [Araneus ventricosus]|uniref:Uncharacterized protein n=1 Tax=Araneus ventricosus TaxID=182803 RepID=A0A4Y2IAE7_ARAVE|nr:hypothetical protein AVEN_73733-1 [Araneus ventricosus]
MPNTCPISSPPSLYQAYKYLEVDPPSQQDHRHTVLLAPTIAESAPFYHPPPCQNFPFSEGHQLTQFLFFVAATDIKPPVKGDVASILQDMSSSPPSFTQPPSSTPTPFTTTSNVVSQMVSTTVSNSTPVITQSTSKTSPLGLSSHSQQLTAIPITTAASTNLSVFTGVSETPETYVLEHFKFSCEITASPDADEEWDFLDDFKPLIPLPAEIALETDEEVFL